MCRFVLGPGSWAIHHGRTKTSNKHIFSIRAQTQLLPHFLLSWGSVVGAPQFASTCRCKFIEFLKTSLLKLIDIYTWHCKEYIIVFYFEHEPLHRCKRSVVAPPSIRFGVRFCVGFCTRFCVSLASAQLAFRRCFFGSPLGSSICCLHVFSNTCLNIHLSKYFLITVFHGALVRDDIIKASLLMFPAPGCGTAIVSWECVCEGDVDGFVLSYFSS